MDIKTLLLSFNGRIGRAQYWSVYGVWLVVYLILLGITSALNSGGNGGALAMIVSLVFCLFALASIWPLLAVQVKRWHDRNKSGWWVLIGLVPVIGGLWALIECGFLPAVEEGNRFNG